MKILNRYILLEITRLTALCLSVFLGILVTARIVKLTSLVVNKGVNPADIALVFVSIIPSFLEIALPMSALLGTMLAFTRLSLDSEIVVMRASGVNLMSLIRPVAIVGIGVTIISFLTSVYLRPLGNSSLASSLFKMASLSTTSNLTEGVFNALGTLSMYTEKINRETGDLEHVLIDDRRDPTHRMIITSSKGKLYSDPVSRMMNLELYEGSIHASQPDRSYTITAFKENIIRLDPQELANQHISQGKKAREMFIPELKEAVYQYEVAGINSGLLEEAKTVYEIELARKLAMPFASIILALLAMPLGIHPPRSHNHWGQSLSFLIGMIIFIIYYALLSVGMGLAKEGSISAVVSLWIPNVILSILAALSLRQMGSEKWNSIFHLLGEFAERIGNRFGKTERLP